MKWYTASEVATIYHVPINTVRTHIERKKFGRDQKLNELGKFKIWLISERGARRIYGSKQ